MHFGAHWGSWAMAIVALIVGLFLILRSRRNKKWNWAAAGGLALILAVGTFVKGWIVWPDHEHFIALVMNGQHDETKAMLTEPNQWTLSDDGSLTILAEDSSKVTLSPDDLPLVPLTPIPVRSWSDAIAGKQGFQFTSVRRKDLTVECTAERGRVRIRHVEMLDTERSIPPDQFRLTAYTEDAPKGDQSTVSKRFVVEVGAPEGKRLHFGTGDSPEKPLTFHEDAPQEPVTFIITGKLVGNEDGETQKLVVDLEEIKAGSTSRSSGAIAHQIEKGKTISDVLSFQIESGLYKQGVPLDLAKVNVPGTAWPRIILHITDKENEPKKDDPAK